MSIADILPGALVAVAVAVAPIPLLWLLIGSVERLLPAGPLKSRSAWLFDAKLALLYLSVPTMLASVIAALVAGTRDLGGGVLADFTPIGSGVIASVIACVLYIAIWDFFYYWWHRAQHGWPALWAMHRLHHLDESLAVSTQMRVHWLEEIGRIPAIFLPMALLFDMPLHSGAAALLLTASSAFIHANLRLQFGRFSAVLAGPQLHRIHHSILPEHADRNFAAFFPVYDVLFGTYRHPARDEFPPTGISGERDVRTVLEAALLPFRRRSEDGIAGTVQSQEVLDPGR